MDDSYKKIVQYGFIIFQTTRSEYDDSEYSVRRRYNDFLWLRQKLEETYPAHLVPVSYLQYYLLHTDTCLVDC